MKVLVLGQGKSGTTALAYKLCNLLDIQQVDFEPKVLNSRKHNSFLAKKLIDNLRPEEHESIGNFDRSVLIVRDPRDATVSRLLYRIRTLKFIRDPKRLAPFLEAIERKERSPSSVSMASIFRVLKEVGGYDVMNSMSRLNARTLDVWGGAARNACVLRYEDFVSGNTGSVAEYLGIKDAFDNSVDVPTNLSRVTRTRSSGNWKDWFIDDDMGQINKAFAPYFSAFGYSVEAPNKRPTLDPEVGSSYIRRILGEVGITC